MLLSLILLSNYDIFLYISSYMYCFMRITCYKTIYKYDNNEIFVKYYGEK